MLTIVETNAAAILTIIILWCLLTWMLTYWVMSERRRKAVAERDDTIDFLDIYCDELHLYINDLKTELDSINAPVSYVLTDKSHYVREEN
jgi:hypothetical protein